MITILCCDDNAEQLKLLKAELSALDIGEPINPYYFTTGEELLDYAGHHGNAVDMVICDILLDEKNGIELAGLIKQQFPHIQVIFMSSFDHLIEDTYHVEHISFLKKPIRRERLMFSIQKAAAAAKTKRGLFITVRCKGAVKKLDISKILYVEAHLREVRIVTELESISAYNRFSEVCAMLDNRFINCHKSYLVNIDKVSQIYRLQFILKNNTVIPIAMARYDEVRKQYLTYLGAEL